MRSHVGSVNLRYLAPPTALLGVLAGLVLSTFLSVWALTLPVGYLALVTGGALYVGRSLPMRTRLRLPLVLATMHMAWGAGFLTSWRPDKE